MSLTSEQINLIFDQLQRDGATDAYDAAVVSCETGMRLGEIVRLRPEDWLVEWPKPASADRQTRGWRDIRLTNRASRVLSERQVRFGRLFGSECDPDATAHMIANAFAQAARRAGIQRARFQALRLSYAQKWLKAGMSLCQLNRIMGLNLSCPSFRSPSEN